MIGDENRAREIKDSNEWVTTETGQNEVVVDSSSPMYDRRSKSGKMKLDQNIARGDTHELRHGRFLLHQLEGVINNSEDAPLIATIKKWSGKRPEEPTMEAELDVIIVVSTMRKLEDAEGG